MIELKICIGSSCYLKGSKQIVEYFKDVIEKEQLEDKIILSGSFCSGKCNRIGVTVTVNEKIYTGITINNVGQFFTESVLPLIK